MDASGMAQALPADHGRHLRHGCHVPDREGDRAEIDQRRLEECADDVSWGLVIAKDIEEEILDACVPIRGYRLDKIWGRGYTLR
jgi:hypothetical protein